MLYEDFAQKQKDAVLSGGSDQNRIRTHVFQALQYLRKVCNHPKLVLHPQHEQVQDLIEKTRWVLNKVQIQIINKFMTTFYSLKYMYFRNINIINLSIFETYILILMTPNKSSVSIFLALSTL